MTVLFYYRNCVAASFGGILPPEVVGKCACATREYAGGVDQAESGDVSTSVSKLLHVQLVQRLQTHTITTTTMQAPTSGAGRILKWAGTHPARNAVIFLSCPSTFLARPTQVRLFVLVSAFVMVSTVWSVSCSLSSTHGAPVPSHL